MRTPRTSYMHLFRYSALTSSAIASLFIFISIIFVRPFFSLRWQGVLHGFLPAFEVLLIPFVRILLRMPLLMTPRITSALPFFPSMLSYLQPQHVFTAGGVCPRAPARRRSRVARTTPRRTWQSRRRGRTRTPAPPPALPGPSPGNTPSTR